MFPILNPHSLLIPPLWVIPVHQPQASITKYCYQIWDLRLDLKLSDFWLVSIWATTHLCFMYLLVQLVMSRECMFLGSLSRHNKDLEWQTLKPPRHVTALGSWIDRVIALRSRKDHVIALRQISVTAQCYSSILFKRYQENPSLRHEGMLIQRHKEKRAPTRTHARESPLAPLFICFPLPGPVLYKLGQPEVLFVLPEVLTPVLGPSFVLFSQAFPFLVF